MLENKGKNCPSFTRSHPENDDIFHIIKLFARIYVYMLAIAGQTAGPNWVNP